MVSFPLACFPCFITRVVVHNNSLESRSRAETAKRPISIAVKFVVRKNARLREVARQLIARIGRGIRQTSEPLSLCNGTLPGVRSYCWDMEPRDPFPKPFNPSRCQLSPRNGPQ